MEGALGSRMSVWQEEEQEDEEGVCVCERVEDWKKIRRGGKERRRACQDV